MTSHEFAEWAAYAQIEPFGPGRDDLRAGLVASVIAEVYRDPQKRAEPFTPADFMPVFDGGPDPGPERAPERPPPEAVFAKLKAGLGLAGKGQAQNGDPE